MGDANNEIVQMAMVAAKALAQAKKCRDDLNRAASGADNPEVTIINDRKQRVKDLLYIWMYNRGAICAHARFVPQYPRTNAEGFYYATFNWKLKFPAQTAFWISETLEKLMAHNSDMFEQVFTYHVNNTYRYCTIVTKGDVLQRLLFDTLYSASVAINAKFEITTRDPNAAKVIKRMRSAVPDEQEEIDNSGKRYIRGPHGERIRVESITPAAQSQKVQDHYNESCRREIIGYYTATSFGKNTKKKPTAIQQAEYMFVQEVLAQLDNVPMEFEHLKANVFGVPPPAISVTPSTIITASAALYKKDKIAELERELRTMCNGVHPIEDGTYDYGVGGTMHGQITYIDVIQPDPAAPPSDFRNCFVELLNTYVSSEAELNAVKKQIKGNVMRERVSEANLIKPTDPNDGYGYWSRHCDNKEKIAEYRQVLETAFEGDAMRALTDEGPDGESIMTVGCLTETRNDINMKITHSKPTNRPASMPKTVLKWEAVWRAIDGAITEIGTMIGRNLRMEVLSNNPNDTRDSIGAVMREIWLTVLNDGALFKLITSHVSAEINRIDPPREPIKVSTVTKDGEKDIIFAS